MNLKQAIEILDYHQSWRQGKTDEMIYEPKVITQALDVVLNNAKKIKKNNQLTFILDDDKIIYYTEETNKLTAIQLSSIVIILMRVIQDKIK